jgi:hypothetical protein
MVNLFIYFALLIYAYYYQKIQVIIFTIKLFNATKTLIDFTTTKNIIKSRIHRNKVPLHNIKLHLLPLK